jgi:RNA polymerase sigma-70 factor, ECF subfamily
MIVEMAATALNDSNDQEVLDALRAGDEEVFAQLVRRHHSSLLRLARVYVSNPATAEEVVQDTWIGLLESLDRFEGRSSLKTWIFRIMINTARKRRGKEARSIPFSSLGPETSGDEATMDPDRFAGSGDKLPGHWTITPANWDQLPEQRLISLETRRVVEEAIETLPPNQKEVITLRDVEGWTAEETCNVLQLTATNQRVILHRARARIRRDLESYFGDPEDDR